MGDAMRRPARILVLLAIVALRPGGALPARGDFIDPGNSGIPSLGVLNQRGNYTFDTSSNMMAPTLTLPNGMVLTGMFVFQNGMAVAAFQFDSVNIPGRSTIMGTGDVPIVILSKDSVTIGNGVSISLLGYPGGSTAVGMLRGMGPGGGGPGTPAAGGGGGGYGGTGGAGAGLGGFGGPSYGDASMRNSFGSGGGAGGADNLGNQAEGGFGGGGLQIGAVDTISIAGTIRVDGSPGQLGQPGGGGAGGGAGGSIILYGDAVSISGTLSANGGAGGEAGAGGLPAGGGGGGRIFIRYNEDNFQNTGRITANGGAAGTGGDGVNFAAAGMNGVITIVPEPASIALLAAGGLALAGCSLARAVARRP